MRVPRRLAGLALAFAAWAAVIPAGAGTLATFKTRMGDIDVELLDADKPVTVTNFIAYVQSGRYQDSFLHRCPPSPFTGITDFVVQGGGYAVTNRGTASASLYAIPTYPEIVNEFGRGRQFTNVYGTLAMAKLGGLTNSATSQWFFNLNNNAFLDANNSNGLFVVFGRVVRGTTVLDQFLGRSYGDGLANAGGSFTEMPVHYSGTRPPTFADLYHTDITLLTARIALAGDGSRVVSWNSVNGIANQVEFRAPDSADWATLASTNGTGGTLQVTDTNAAPQRLYRVRVDF